MKLQNGKAKGANPPKAAGPSGRGAAQKALGNRGEALAAEHLARQGYSLLARNYWCGYGEADLIARRGEYLVFVEVKSRGGANPLHPSLSVGPHKQATLRKVALEYLARVREGTLSPQAGGASPGLERLQPRFDVVSVWLDGDGCRLEHLENAF